MEEKQSLDKEREKLILLKHPELKKIEKKLSLRNIAILLDNHFVRYDDYEKVTNELKNQLAKATHSAQRDAIEKIEKLISLLERYHYDNEKDYTGFIITELNAIISKIKKTDLGDDE